MRRFMVFAVLVAVSLTLSMNLSTAGDEPATLSLEKECVLIGRIATDRVALATGEHIAAPVYYPEMIGVEGVELLNVATGEWHPLPLTEDGYFSANVEMGKYDLQVRDTEGRPFIISSFSVPNKMLVNLGTWRVEGCDPEAISVEGWESYLDESYVMNPRFVRRTGEGCYECCEEWFSSCQEEVYKKFADVNVIVRR